MRFKSEHKIGTFQRHTGKHCRSVPSNMHWSKILHTLSMLATPPANYQLQETVCSRFLDLGEQGKRMPTFQYHPISGRKSWQVQWSEPGEKREGNTDTLQAMNNWGKGIFTWAGRADAANWLFKPFGNWPWLQAASLTQTTPILHYQDYLINVYHNFCVSRQTSILF